MFEVMKMTLILSWKKKKRRRRGGGSRTTNICGKKEEVVLEIEEDKYSFERDSFSSSSESTLDEKKDIRKKSINLETTLS